MCLGDQLGLQALGIGTLDRSGQIDPPFQALQLWALGRMGQGVGLESPARFRQSSQLPIKGAAEGIDEQGSEILSMPGSKTWTGVAPSQQTGKTCQPGHIQALGLDRALHPPTHVATGF